MLGHGAELPYHWLRSHPTFFHHKQKARIITCMSRLEHYNMLGHVKNEHYLKVSTLVMNSIYRRI